MFELICKTSIVQCRELGVEADANKEVWRNKGLPCHSGQAFFQAAATGRERSINPFFAKRWTLKLGRRAKCRDGQACRRDTEKKVFPTGRFRFSSRRVLHMRVCVQGADVERLAALFLSPLRHSFTTPMSAYNYSR